ncbi:S8 family peptidase [Pedococcus sp. 5OH_020]|uniref:S8 family peptidase n=1 Tax=Pedococcus sp. 5OH_020 TaxID=2989814 RepID=UPI0022EA0E47|nr:S8 family peptidase [Pedococcus sp. 5OH_020]
MSVTASPTDEATPRSARHRSGTAWALALAATVSAVSLCAAGPAQADHTAPLKASSGKLLADKYIVVLNDGASGAATAKRLGVKTSHVYSATIDGFSATLTKAQLSKVRHDASVKYVSQDGQVTAVATKPTPPMTSARVAPGSVRQSSGPSSQVVQGGATWGIDRIDQRTGLNGQYLYTTTGLGVRAYVVDTGIYTAHSQFGGRATVGFDALGGNGQDCNGHGTHVAGTIGGATYGVAKQVSLTAVRVLDCSGSGSWSGFIAGADYVTYTHNGPSVANASLGGGYNAAVNDAVARSTAQGVTWAIAAGNSATDACTQSPGSSPSAITVGATLYSGGYDYKAGFSNYGPCVDIFAPGQSITSSWIGSTTAINTISGTSMASPHVAGLAALYLQQNPYATPALVSDALKSTSARNVVYSAGTGSPNLFARKWNSNLLSGQQSVQPDGSYWYQANPGYIQGWVQGTAGTDTDLLLDRWNGSSWVLVAASTSLSNKERVVYNGAGASYYRFRILNYSGAGSSDLFTNHPN